MRIIILLIFIFTTLFCYSQTDSISPKKNIYNKLTYGIIVSILPSTDLNKVTGNTYTTSGVINFSNHSLTLGPLWWTDQFNKNANAFRGDILSYQYYLHGKHDALNFYFVYDMLYNFEKDDWTKNMQFDANNYYDVNFNGFWQSMKTMIGYGFNVKIYKGFYINNCISIGFEFYNYSSKTTVNGAPNLSSTFSSGNIFQDSRTCGMIKLGIGYNLK